jgi:prolyl 4-hydroxylase
MHTVFKMLSPRIELYGDVLTRYECETIIDLAKPNLKKVSKDAVQFSPGSVYYEREYLSAGLDPEDPFVKALNERLAVQFSYPVDTPSTPFRVFKYGVGDSFPPHVDNHYLPPKGDPREMTTLILYLNQGFGGGSTAFTRLDLEVIPVTGHALLFVSTKDGAEDKRSQHTGAEVTEGEKWVCTKWFLR